VLAKGTDRGRKKTAGAIGSGMEIELDLLHKVLLRT